MITPYYAGHGVEVYLGDCALVLAAMPEIAAFVIADPPYLVGYKGRWNSNTQMITGDDRNDWVVPAYAALWRAMQADTLAVSFYGWPHADIFVGAWKCAGFRPLSHLAFAKNVWGLGYYTRAHHESAYLLGKGKPPKPQPVPSDLIPWRRVQNPIHANEKPVSSLVPLIESYCPPGGLVLDPFAGSGSTLEAAIATGRRAIGIELDPAMCAAIVARIERYARGEPAPKRTPRQRKDRKDAETGSTV